MFPQTPDSPATTLSDKHTIETPEQLRLDFAIAGIGTRFLAMAIDTLIQIAVAIAMTVVLGLSGAVLAAAGTGSMWMVALAVFSYFLLFYGYFIFFEILWNGQTPGKRSMGIRVIKESGRPLTAGESIGRNLLRIVDQLPGFYGIGIVAAVLNSRNMRLGDMLAGSIVVRESSLAALRPDWQTANTDHTRERILGVGELSAEDLNLIDSFLSRRAGLSEDVRSTMAGQILAKLRMKLSIREDPALSNESILESLARERRSVGGHQSTVQ